jgi:hypothetical protein
MSADTRKAFEAWAKARGYGVIRAANGPYIWDTTDEAWKVWTASRSQALEEAALACNEVLDMKEEARAEQASHEARGTADELARLKHWATVSTFNAGVRRCIAAIRKLGAQE